MESLFAREKLLEDLRCQLVGQRLRDPQEESSVAARGLGDVLRLTREEGREGARCALKQVPGAGSEALSVSSVLQSKALEGRGRLSLG